MRKENLKQNKAITLVALIITIIILLILATITIEGLKNTNLFSKTIDAKNKYKQAEANEANILDDYANKINEIAGGTAKSNATKISSTDGSKIIEVSGNKVTVTENGTSTTVTIDTTKDPSSTEKDSSGNWKNDYDANTKNVLSKIYGTEVEYTGSTDITAKTWKIFYIDFANKYGDGAGTIYLKADWTANDTTLSGQFSYTPTDADKTIIENMNKKWYTAKGTAPWNENEHEAAWLCSPSQWTKYKNSSANYAIGSPSTEMYCDSYNSVNHSAENNNKLTCQYQTSAVPGYGYLVNGAIQNSGYYTNNNTLDTSGYSTMYCKSGDYYWWLASPSAIDSNFVCIVSGNYARLGNGNDDYANGVCPLVSLQSGIQLNIK